jgi:uncharacterized protein (DUF433 family)
MTSIHRKVSPFVPFDDPRDAPAYSVSEAAHYLCMPEATLRSWVRGTGKFQRVILLPRRDSNLLSFFNLAEAHVLRALRVRHKVPLPMIRRAVRFVERKFGWERPLIQQQFKTDGAAMFIEHLGELLDASAEGQKLMREVMDAHLQRLEWENNVVARLYPFTHENGFASPRSVLIDPRFSFGRPVLRKSHVATAVIAERYKAGDAIDDLAQDYGCPRLEIEEAVRCELRVEAAATFGWRALSHTTKLRA